jgi:hypothetical protein
MMLSGESAGYPVVIALITVIFLCGLGIGFIQGRRARG